MAKETGLSYGEINKLIQGIFPPKEFFVEVTFE